MQFCEDVRMLARQIASNCVKDQRFRHCFINTQTSKIQDPVSKCRAIQGLHAAIGNLEKRLGDYVHKPNDPLFTLVFDEVHGLINKSGQNGPVIALNMLIRTKFIIKILMVNRQMLLLRCSIRYQRVNSRAIFLNTFTRNLLARKAIEKYLHSPTKLSCVN